jgi:hypothetical protein
MGVPTWYSGPSRVFPLHLGPVDAKETGLEAHARLALLLTVLVGESFRVQIAQFEPNEHPPLGLDVGQQLPHDTLGFTAGDLAIEAGVLHLPGSAVQRRHLDGQKRLAALGSDLTHSVQIANTENVQIEVVTIGCRVCHGISPDV